MLVNKNTTQNWSAVSAINVSEGTGEPVMYMNAVFNGREISFSKNIQNYDLYVANKEVVDADYAQFEKDVEEDLK
jgi:hypothetical protein